MKKQKNPNRLPGRVYAGTSLMSSTQGLTASLMSSFFMLYLTDYSGLGAYAATLGSAILVFARVFDAVNDPLEGWILDRAKPGKNGKYRPFVWLSLALVSIGVILLFWIPEAISDQPVMVTIYVVIAYLLYDIGYSFFVPELVYRTLTLDAGERGKLFVGPRLVVMVWGMVCSALIAIVTAINMVIQNMHASFGIAVCVITILAALLSFVGTLMFKEKYIPQPNQEDPVKFRDLLLVLKENKAFLNRTLAGIFGGFIYTFMFATATYYAKWAYCADLTTGEVDSAKFGLYTLLISMISFSPLILGTILGNPIMKALKSAKKASIVLTLAQAIPLGILFVLQMVGVLQAAPALFFIALIIASFAMGAGYIPTGVINIEVMDYDLCTNGKERSALMSSVSKLLEKAQNALATAAVGVILTAVGYVVDSETDMFLGDLEKMPGMLNWFSVVFGLLPLICGIAYCVIFARYPITDKVREDMKVKIAEIRGQK